MPRKLENKLRRQGQAKGYTGERLSDYIYGTMRKTGWKPRREKKLSSMMQ